jgi:hypothetical protein
LLAGGGGVWRRQSEDEKDGELLERRPITTSRRRCGGRGKGLKLASNRRGRRGIVIIYYLFYTAQWGLSLSLLVSVVCRSPICFPAVAAASTAD